MDCDGFLTPHRYVTINYVKTLVTLDDMRIEFDERESAMKNVDKLPVKATLDAKINWAATRDTPEVAALRGPTNMPRLLAEYTASVYAAEKGSRCDVIVMCFLRLTWGLQYSL